MNIFAENPPSSNTHDEEEVLNINQKEEEDRDVTTELIPMMKVVLNINEQQQQEDEDRDVTTEVMVVDWLNLPDHIMRIIAEKLFPSIQDFIRFGDICRSWRSIYHTQTKFARFCLPLPLLMLPSSELAIKDETTCCFYDLLERKICNNILLPIPRDRYYCGSSHGWLITVTRSSPAVAHIFNPFLSSSSLELPSLEAFDFLEDEDGCTNEVFFTKIILSANPTVNSNNYLVVAIFGSYNRLAFCKPGDNAWTCLVVDPNSKDVELSGTNLEDVVCYKNQVYAIDYFGGLWSFDLNASNPKLFCVVPPPPPSLRRWYMKRYLVQSCGHLLQVGRIMRRVDKESNDYFTTKFQIFKLDWIDREWHEIRNICGQMLFIGDNESTSLPASDYPGCKPNCIYYTDDYVDGYSYEDSTGPLDMRIYNLEHDSFEPHYQVIESKKKILPAPIWIEPAYTVLQ